MAREIIASPLVFGWSWPVFGLAAALSTILAAMNGAFATGQILGPLAGSLSFELAGSFAPAMVTTSVALVGTALATTGKAAGARSVVHL